MDERRDDMEVTEQTLEDVLTPRQLEIYGLDQQGLSTRQIAEKLVVSRVVVVDTLKRARMKVKQAGLAE
jgi:predicted DNA-binding protein (UPF0251 family)